MSKKIERLTDAQKARFGEWAQRYIQIGLSTEPADFDRANAAALRAYELLNLKKPMVVLRVGSPYAASMGGALAWWMLRNLKIPTDAQVRDQVRDQVRAQVGAQVRDQVWAQVGDQVGAQVWAQVGDQVRDQVWAQVGDQVRDQVGDQVRDQVGDQVGAQVRDQVGAQVWDQVGAQVWDQVGDQVRDQVGDQKNEIARFARDGLSNQYGGQLWHAGWVAFATFMRDVVGVTIDAKFSIEQDLAESCGWVWWHQNVLAISDRPSLIKRDENNLLHCENGPSIAYRDGWQLFHWHGVSVPPEWITDKRITAAEALNWQNVEQRRAACEIIGWAKVLEQLSARVIDTDDDEEIGQLLEAEIPESGLERFLKVRCGTGRAFVLPVPRECKTAHEANAWTYGLDAMSFKPEVRT